MDNIPISKQRCPSCTKTKMILDEDKGELFCSFCGYVAPEQIVQDGPEWRSFSADGSDRSRVGAGTSITMHDMGLSTVIGTQNKDATGKPLDSSMKKSINRLRTWDSRSQAHTSVERIKCPCQVKLLKKLHTFTEKQLKKSLLKEDQYKV